MTEEHILFLTGHLAYESLCRELEGLKKRSFSYRVHDLGIKVAALMSADLIRRRLTETWGADRIIIPGLCTGSIAALSEHFAVPVERGPKDLKDLAEYFGTQGRQIDYSRHNVKLFAEIVDAPQRSVAEIIARAKQYRADGADVIDLGCVPDCPFGHLEESIEALHDLGLAVSIDSLLDDDLLRAGKAGVDYMLSLKESNLWIIDQFDATPVVIPDQPGDMDSLYRACETLAARGRVLYADPVLEPIHFGFTASVVRYYQLRQRLPEVNILMGTGNVSELTDADTTGINAVLMGMVSELNISAILTTEVSEHCRSVVRETDIARRIMYAAARDGRLPRSYHPGLMALHERKPFPYSDAEIATTAAAVKDANFRIQVSASGIHIYNRDGCYTATEPYALFPSLGVENDGGHAFYLGVELARAQIAWQLGKRYLQDNELSWGCTVALEEQDLDLGFKAAGTTLHTRGDKSKG